MMGVKIRSKIQKLQSEINRLEEIDKPNDPIYRRVRDVLCLCLALDEEEISLTSKLGKDLGCDSIDRLDVTFHLQKEFQISISRGELFKSLDAIEFDRLYCMDERLTTLGIEKLKERMPYADLTEFLKNPRTYIFYELLDVKLIVDFIKWKLSTSKK